MARRNAVLATVFVLTLALGVVLGWVGKGMAAGEPLPGSEQDPLVSKSYVDSKVQLYVDAKVESYVEERIQALLSQIPAGSELKVVELSPGQKLIARAGAEIIVRGGTATVIDSELGGLCDVTAGKDLRMGENAPANHLLLVPRNDGRGIEAVSAVIVMVRGVYTIE